MNKKILKICFFTAIPLLILSVYNICTKGLAFFDASIVNVMTIFIAVIISYSFVQRKNDQRKQKDILVDLIFKLQKQITSQEAYDFSNQSQPITSFHFIFINYLLVKFAPKQNVLSDSEPVRTDRWRTKI